MKIGVVGSGAAGLSASWLLEKQHNVVLLESDTRPGGHAHTAWVDSKTFRLSQEQTYLAGSERLTGNNQIAIDTGFIVYNEHTYPNFTAWLNELGIESEATNMSFAVSKNGGDYEYAGGTKTGLTAQPSNLFKGRFWRMWFDLVRFYRQSVSSLERGGGANEYPNNETLGDFLDRGGYSKTFIEDHLLPFAAAIWSTPQTRMLDYPVASFVQFCENHGLLKLINRPQWRTLTEGSASYVSAVTETLSKNNGLRLGFKVVSIDCDHRNVTVTAEDGRKEVFDHLVLACHADQALALLGQTDSKTSDLLDCFAYEKNQAILHTDAALMPKRRKAWASWNFVEPAGCKPDSQPGVVYWMNKLQNLDCEQNFFVSLNPSTKPAAEKIVRSMSYEHPVFNHATLSAQRQLWNLQGKNRLWYCGSYFGAGFHEDAVQSGLAVAEQLGNSRRPWSVENESSRIFLARSEAEFSESSIQNTLTSVPAPLEQAAGRKAPESERV